MFCRILVNSILFSVFLEVHVEAYAQKMPRMDYPKGFLDRKSQKELKRYYKQGFTLYLGACAGCHGPNDALNTITSFTDAQIQNYSLRSSTEHIPVFRDRPITEEELTRILTFLKFMEKPKIELE